MTRNNYREESTDDDLVPKRHHRQRYDRQQQYQSRGSRDTDQEDGDNPGVSSRGRVRRANPRLFD